MTPLSKTTRSASYAALLLAAACSSDGGNAANEADLGAGGEMVSEPMGTAGSGGSEQGAAGAAGDGAGGDTSGAGGVGGTAAVDPTVETVAECPTGEPDADGDGLCDDVDPCPRDARVALWFPADTSTPVVDALAVDLQKAENMTSITILTDTDGPTAEELRAEYDAVVVGSNWGFGAKTADEMGDLLADYVDAGGLVVDTMFNQTSWTGMGTQEALGGRWASEGYGSMQSAVQINAALSETTLTLTEPTDSLVQGLTPDAFLGDLVKAQPLYMTAGQVNADGPLGFVELAHWTYAGEDHPAIVVSTDSERTVLGLVLSPILNFDTFNSDPTTRDFLACSISRLVR